jgi:WD40 repeat protein
MTNCILNTRSSIGAWIMAKKSCAGVIAGGILCALLSGCGSSGGGGGTTPPPPPPSFTVTLSPTSVTLSQGGAGQAVQLSVTAKNGFTGTVSVSPATLPTGVTASPASLSLTPSVPGIFTFSASSAALIAQQTVNLNASSGTLAVSASLGLTVTGAAVSDPLHLIGGTLVHGFYDETRQLLFVSNPGLNELDVISGQDFSIKARVPVPQPWGIDQMADGNTLVLGTQAQDVVTVDEDSLAVTLHPCTGLDASRNGLFFPVVIAMANGKVLMNGLEPGIDSDNIYEAGEYLYEWDSVANTCSQLEAFGADSLARSADHKWAVFSSDQFYLYSSDTNSMQSVSVNTVNPPNNEFGIRGYAINADGSEIAVASASQVTFLNSSLVALASTPIPGAFQTARTAVQFSANGQTLYLQYDMPLEIEEINTSSYKTLGYITGDVATLGDNNLERLLTTDAEGRAYTGIAGELRVVNLGQSPVPNPTTGFGPVNPNCPNLGVSLPLKTSQQLSLLATFTGSSVYVGGLPAPLLDGGTAIELPASSVAGPADEECVGTDGDALLVQAAVSYGVQPLALSANLLPPTGNPTVYLYGYGFQASAGETPSVTVGGSSVKVTPFSYSATPLEGEAIQVPNGTPGASVNVAVSSSVGNGTLTAAATYYPAPTIVPTSGVLQLLYDSHRNLLYALKATEVDVLNPASLQWQSPIVLPQPAPSVSYATMALSPDGSWLVVGSADSHIVVFDPDQPAHAQLLTSSLITSLSSLTITEFDKVILSGSQVVELDLSSLNFTALHILAGALVRASADGTHVYGIDPSAGSKVYSIDPSSYTVQSVGFDLYTNGFTDIAVLPNGSQFAAIYGPPFAAGDIAAFYNSSAQYINANVYPDFSPPDDTSVIGATFSPAGKVLAVPLGDSIEFWSTAQDTLLSRLMTPEELHVWAYPEVAVSPLLALDSAGQTIYAVSSSGLTVLTLPEPLDQMPATQWPSAYSSGGARFGFQRSLASGMRAMHRKPKK